MKHLTKFLLVFCAACLLSTLSACAVWSNGRTAKQAGSVVDYLYPNAKEAPQLQEGVTLLRPPVRVGIAFVPSAGHAATLAETDKLVLLERVKAAFSQHPFIGTIEVIPTSYLRAGGGFTNLDQMAKMFNVEVVALTVNLFSVQSEGARILSGKIYR